MTTLRTRAREGACVVLALYLLILFSPFVIASAIAGSARATSFIARHYWPCLSVGWLAVALLVPAAILFDGVDRVISLAFVCPPIALSFWRRAEDSEGGDGDGPEQPPPDGPEIDWDRFYRDVDEWARKSRDSSPVAH